MKNYHGIGGLRFIEKYLDTPYRAHVVVSEISLIVRRGPSHLFIKK